MDKDYINKRKRDWYKRNIEREQEKQRVYRITYNEINRERLSEYHREYMKDYRKGQYRPRQKPLPKSSIKIEHRIFISFQ
jgi:hypothetical protein